MTDRQRTSGTSSNSLDSLNAILTEGLQPPTAGLDGPAILTNRKRVDYSYGATPMAGEKPVSVGRDPLLRRLMEGRR